MKKCYQAAILAATFTLFGFSSAQALIWGVNPTATNELVNIDPFTGTISQSYDLGGMISSNDTEAGLAGWANTLYYTNEQYNNGTIYKIDPTTGATTGSFTVSGGWGMDGLGYYSTNGSSYLYTSGCSVDDVHRYNALDGASPQFYWSNVTDPRAIAGDNGGRIFAYGRVGDVWGIYEMDPLTNTSASLFAASPSTTIMGMAFDGLYLYLSDSRNKLYTMDTSGTLINTLDLGYNLYALASTEGTGSEVPEPATMLLLGTGLAGLAARARRKAKE